MSSASHAYTVDWPAVASAADHRPWPTPRAPWLMQMSWADLLFAHWPIDPAAIRPRLPAGLELDTFDGQAWLGVVPFRMANVGPRGLPAVPHFSAFPELNIRTYVVADGKPGVWFFSLDAASRPAVWGGRTFFHVPYCHASIRMGVGDDGWVTYDCRRTDSRVGPGAFVGRYRPIGDIDRSRPGTLDYWLTERYCLYAADRRGRLFRTEVHHRQWPLQPAEAEIATNTITDAHGFGDLGPPALLHFAWRVDVVAWNVRRVDGTG